MFATTYRLPTKINDAVNGVMNGAEFSGLVETKLTAEPAEEEESSESESDDVSTGWHCFCCATLTRARPQLHSRRIAERCDCVDRKKKAAARRRTATRTRMAPTPALGPAGPAHAHGESRCGAGPR